MSAPMSARGPASRDRFTVRTANRPLFFSGAQEHCTLKRNIFRAPNGTLAKLFDTMEISL